MSYKILDTLIALLLERKQLKLHLSVAKAVIRIVHFFLFWCCTFLLLF